MSTLVPLLLNLRDVLGISLDLNVQDTRPSDLEPPLRHDSDGAPSWNNLVVHQLTHQWAVRQTSHRIRRDPQAECEHLALNRRIGPLDLGCKDKQPLASNPEKTLSLRNIATINKHGKWIFSKRSIAKNIDN